MLAASYTGGFSCLSPPPPSPQFGWYLSRACPLKKHPHTSSVTTHTHCPSTWLPLGLLTDTMSLWEKHHGWLSLPAETNFWLFPSSPLPASALLPFPPTCVSSTNVIWILPLPHRVEVRELVYVLFQYAVVKDFIKRVSSWLDHLESWQIRSTLPVITFLYVCHNQLCLKKPSTVASFWVWWRQYAQFCTVNGLAVPRRSRFLSHPYGVGWIWTLLNHKTTPISTSGLCNCRGKGR